jgi:hypothetical protein
VTAVVFSHSTPGEVGTQEMALAGTSALVLAPESPLEWAAKAS